ncbi:MAG: phosphate acyltransferase PlsX [Desulfovibrio sp.]|uniref:phosphate acyltransferase PlsX n=1 Tax=Desulfovibrio sp. 7SRBS1 TaxID=3378064 RepID=UPI003B4200B8
MNNRPRIAVDAMGGDIGPSVVVPGAVSAAKKNGIDLILVGKPGEIEDELGKLDTDGLAIEVVEATEIATMKDKPTDVVRRKKDSSIYVACRLVRDGNADGFVSAGNTGATLACGIFVLGRLKGVERPALASILPTEKKPLVLVDVGANVDAKASQLIQFGIMADCLATTVLDYHNPRIALLSIGEEEGKGNSQIKQAFDMLRSSSLNFTGNVEGRDLFTGDVDIVVCDGFVGNVALKLSEGLSTSLARLLKRELLGNLFSKLGTLLSSGALKRFKRLVDYAEYGGAPLLGLNGIGIVCHGASNEKAMMNAVKMAARYMENGANDRISQRITESSDLTRFSRGRQSA